MSTSHKSAPDPRQVPITAPGAVQRGTIIKLIVGKGFGFIVPGEVELDDNARGNAQRHATGVGTANGAQYFFHLSSLDNGADDFATLDVGDVVEFVGIGTVNGPRAIRVSKI